MDNFKYHVCTEILFGKGQIQRLPSVLAPYGKNVLLAYGGGSIQRNGIYETVKELLRDFNILEFAGIEPNPRLTTVERGRDLCLSHNIDVILAVGGGSVIDCAKAVAAAYYYNGKAWDLIVDPTKIRKALPIVTVLTMAGTGSEMNKNAVITDTSRNLKLGMGSMLLIPQTSIIDPTYMYTLPEIQTAAGAADTFSHVLENYFKRTADAFVQDKISEGLLLSVIKFAPIALANPRDYAARANLAWASSLALNGLIGSGKMGHWSVHPIEHELSAYYDLTHGIGLAILTPAWMRHILNDETVDKFCEYGINVWKLPDTLPKMELANAAIDATESFFKGLGIPMTLHEVGIDETNFEVMAKKSVEFGGLASAYIRLNVNDVMDILKACK